MVKHFVQGLGVFLITFAFLMSISAIKELFAWIKDEWL